MSRNSELAFMHPEARAKATAPEGAFDRLSLTDHIVEVEIGAFQAERGMTQRISFDVVVEVAAPEADLEDDVDRILSYDRITWAIEHELQAERLNLLETLAERIADRILQEPQAQRVFVRIKKLDKGNGHLGVEIERVPGQSQHAAAQSLQPIVAFLGSAAIRSPNLGGWITQLCAAYAPLVLCLDLPKQDETVPDTLARKHIELLAIEQAAWRLSAAFPALTVAGTRTELDWAMKNDLPTIWAPSKLVLDATDQPPESAAELAAWFGVLWSAKRLVMIGEQTPVSNTIPTQFVTLDQTEI